MRTARLLVPALTLVFSGLQISCTPSPAKAPLPLVVSSAPVVTPIPVAAAVADAPPPPLDRDFVHVLLPAGTGTLSSISGRAADDVWILTDEGALLHLSGDRVVKTYQPEPCMQVAAFRWLSFSAGDDMQLLGEYQDPGGRLLAAPFDPVKGVAGTCGPSAAFTGLDCPWDHAWGVNSGDGRQCTLRDIRLPDFDPFAPQAGRVKLDIARAWVKGDDGWFVARLGEGAEERDALLRYNGVTWVPVAEIDAGLVFADAAFDKAGNAWILVKPPGAEGPSTAVYRLEGRSLTRVKVPPSFAAERADSAGPTVVWFLGVERKLFEWDGAVMHEGELPFPPTNVWGSPSGDLWITGEKDNQLAHTIAKQVTR